MPQLSFTTFAIGARQFVVHEAFETIAWPAYLLSFTPMTNIGVSSFDGADITTFLAPAARWVSAPALSRKRPVASSTLSAPPPPPFRFVGSFSAVCGFSDARTGVVRSKLGALYTAWRNGASIAPLGRRAQIERALLVD